MMSTLTSNIDVALTLARQGYHVFPCHGGGEKVKQPMPFVMWRKQSTTNEHQIMQWWSKWPDAVPGLDLDKSGLLVIDCDRHGEHDGVEAFGRLMGEHDFHPDGAPLVATPNEGNHHYFRQPSGRTLGNGRGTLPAGIDVRGSGGYVIAPGSIMQDGRFYELWGDLSASPELPQWLFEIIETRQSGAETPARQPQPLAPQAPRGGDQICDDEIAELLSYIPADVGYHEWVAVLMAIHAETDGAGFNLADQWSAKGSKYPGSKELAKKWRSFKGGGVSGRSLAAIARGYGADLSEIAAKYRGTQPPAGYDAHQAKVIADSILQTFMRKRSAAAMVEVEQDAEDIGAAADQADMPDAMLNLGGVVGDLADWICSWTSEPIRIHAIGAALTIVGTIIGRKVYTQKRPTCTALYIGAIAPSGLGKQHAQNAIKLALDEVAGHGTLHTGWSVSLPMVASNLQERASRVMIADEFADKLAGLRNRNASTSQTAISEGLRSLWGINVSSYSPDASLSRGNITIHRPNMSFFGSSTIKDFSRSLVSKDVTNGLFNRFLILPRFSLVDPLPDPEGFMRLPEALKQRLSWLYNCLRDPMQVSLAVRGDGFPSDPVMVPFSDKAAAMDEANKQHQMNMVRASETDDALALYGRFAEQIKRVALIVACGRSPADLKGAVIDARDMEFARALVEYSISQFVLMVRRDMVENVVEANRAAVLRVIRQHGLISRSSLLRQIRHIGARDMRDILSLLIEAQCVVEEMIPTKTKPASGYRYLRG